MKGNRRNIPPAAPASSAATTAPAPAVAPLPSPASPTAKGLAKYTNKDGSKFITVPKAATADAQPPASIPSPTLSTEPSLPSTMNSTGPANGSAPAGNRKKAKRRAKAAAREKKTDEAGLPDGGPGMLPPNLSRQGERGVYSINLGTEIGDSGDDGALDTASNKHSGGASIHDPAAGTSKAKKSKKKKKKKEPAVGADADGSAESPHLHQPETRPPATKEKIWNTNSQEERQRIKEFWLDLSEDERKSLVKVEKDTVLKKMKEQQKMTCSCHFCGRKRTAIEEELEGLYDSYYEELEQFANDPAGQQNGRTPALMSSAGRFGLAHSHHSHAPTSGYAGHQPSRGRIIEHAGEDEDDDLDDEYGDDDDDDDEDDLVPEDDESEGDEEDIPPEEIHRDYATDFFNFGNSLQVHGGILTVADDLLKNDGRKFIEMMEQLAERRMAREEDAKDQYGVRGGFAPGTNGAAYGHNHHIPSEEDDYGPEDEDDEEYDSQDEEYDEEEDAMTEEQRMEEGRRMFQIFAARMFEQRVLTAYREKVAKERQRTLLQELDEEKEQESLRKEKKAKEAQKRKDKAAQKKKALADEKARKEAEKEAEAAERRAQEARRDEEQRQKNEEKRKKREAHKKAEEEDRLRKEAERQRRIHEQKEQERKAREAKEREKKQKEEARQREKEEQERRERESRERKEKQERDKREKDARARANEARERQRQEERAAQKAALVPAVPHVPAILTAATAASSSTPAAPIPITLPKRPSQQQQQNLQQQQHPHQQQPHANTVPALPQQPPQPSSFASPQAAVATPALQKAPTPMRPRQLSQQGGSTAGSQSGTASRTASLSGSGQSQNASPNPMTPVQASAGSFGPGAKLQAPIGLGSLGGPVQGQAQFGAFQPTSPLSGSTRPVTLPQHQTSPFAMAPSPTGLPYQMGGPPVTLPPGFGPPSQYAPMGGAGFRGAGPPGMLPMPSGMNGMGRGFAPMVPPPPGFGLPMPPDQMGSVTPIGSLPTDNGIGPATHSRQPSGGFDPGSSPGLVSQPIGRPAPIGRPGSTVHGQRPGSGSPVTGLMGASDAEDLLGSRALLDDSDFALDGFSTMRPAPPARSTFGASAAAAFGVDITSPFMSQSSLWGTLPQHHIPNSFASVPPPNFGVGGGAPGGGWGMPANNVASFGAHHSSLGRSTQGRSVTLRQLLCRTCKELAAQDSPTAGGGDEQLIPIDVVTSRVNALAPTYLAGPVQDGELDMLYDTEGNGKNGGGNFDVRRGHDGSVTAIRWVPDSLLHRFNGGGGLGGGMDAASPAAVGFGDGMNMGANNTAPIGAAAPPR